MRLYHNPRCSKSREARNLLDERGVDFEEYRYLEQGIHPDDVSLLSNIEGIIRVADLDSKEEVDLADPNSVSEYILENPQVLQRPILVSNGVGVIGRPPERKYSLFFSRFENCSNIQPHKYIKICLYSILNRGYIFVVNRFHYSAYFIEISFTIHQFPKHRLSIVHRSSNDFWRFHELCKNPFEPCKSFSISSTTSFPVIPSMSGCSPGSPRYSHSTGNLTGMKSLQLPSLIKAPRL